MRKKKRRLPPPAKIAACVGLGLIFLLICPERFLIFIAAVTLIYFGLSVAH